MAQRIIPVRRIIEDLSLSESEKMAEEDAKNRVELLGVISCHSKRPSVGSHKPKEQKYGRGKTFHFDPENPVWQEYRAGKITYADFRKKVIAEEGKSPYRSRVRAREQTAFEKKILERKLAIAAVKA